MIMKNEIEADGFVTRDEDLKPLERAGENRAIPVRDCLYPKCEECDDYHGHYCTVPMVVSKQIYRLFEERLYSIEHRLESTEKLVTAQILGEREPNAELTRCDETNFTWDDYLKGE